MAEERLIDDDLNKDKKYRIRKNADGEDELFIDETETETETAEMQFAVPEFGYDDEEAAILTPEQLAAREEAKREDENRRRSEAEKFIASARESIANGEYESALFALNSAYALLPDDGEVNMLRLITLSRNFTDCTMLDECAETAEKVSAFCTESQKAELAAASAPLSARKDETEEKAAAMHVEVERGKQERRITFLEDRKKSVLWFSLTCLVFVVCLVVTIAFSTVMFAKQDGTNLILTLVFAGVSAVLFIVMLITAHRMWDAMKKLSLNEKNSSTKLGREYEETLADISKMNDILASFTKTE